jgi:hypothetical protein
METSPRPRLAMDDEGFALEYRDAENRLLWRICINNIVLVAEYTTTDGPWLDDYFLVFFSVADTSLNVATASFYSDGRDDTLKALALHLGTAIELSFLGSTTWASRVVWPPALAGNDYFESNEVAPRTATDRIKRLAFGEVRDYFPSAPVRNFLMTRKGTQPSSVGPPAMS